MPFETDRSSINHLRMLGMLATGVLAWILAINAAQESDWIGTGAVLYCRSICVSQGRSIRSAGPRLNWRTPGLELHQVPGLPCRRKHSVRQVERSRDALDNATGSSDLRRFCATHVDSGEIGGRHRDVRRVA